ncbi:MAG TPA: hypothetical protein VKZ18_07475 [Polyangia bacterium]|nr:hypothetical protein [Polyangia bacterium]
MRSCLLLSSVMAAAAGGCNQSLTSNMTGTGGAGTGTGGLGPGAGGSGDTGGGPFGTGGMGGSIGPPACSTLEAEYRSAFSAAETCQVGAAGQCQQLYYGALSGCECPTYVTDSTALTTIEQAWQAAGCNTGPEPPCGLCPAPLNTTCVSVDGGSLGACSYAPGTGGTTGAGGATGQGGSGGSTADGGVASCSQLASEYTAVLEGAKSCTSGVAEQCTQLVPAGLSPCPPCPVFVNDRGVLDAIRQAWTTAGCGNVAVSCPQIACPAPKGAACLPSDAGGAVCSPAAVVATG